MEALAAPPAPKKKKGTVVVLVVLVVVGLILTIVLSILKAQGAIGKTKCDPKCTLGQGKCVNGACVCNDGYSGADCSIKSTDPENDPPAPCKSCVNGGTCDPAVGGDCVCPAGWGDATCSTPYKSCVPACVNGICDTKTGTCKCATGWEGTADCTQKSCAGGCGDNGKCDGTTGKCKCNSGYSGSNCTDRVAVCTPDCGAHGTCQNGTCVCDAGWTGAGCATQLYTCNPACKNGASCNTADGKCLCQGQWAGVDCGARPADRETSKTTTWGLAAGTTLPYANWCSDEFGAGWHAVGQGSGTKPNIHIKCQYN